MTTPTADMLADPALIDLASQIVDVCWRQALPRAEDQMVDEPSRKAYCVSVAVYGIAEHISSHAAVAAIVQRARREERVRLLHEVCYDCSRGYPIVIRESGPNKGQEMHVSMEGRAFNFCGAPELRKRLETQP